MTNNLNLEYILNLIKSPKFLSSFPEVTSEHLKDVENQFNLVSSSGFTLVDGIESISQGLVNQNLSLSLEESWGVELNRQDNLFISSPNNLRLFGDKILVSNTSSLIENVSCCELDLNLNFRGYIGKVGSNLNSGEYSDSVDLAYSEQSSCYYIVSKSDNIVHYYDSKTKQYSGSIGSGIAGAEGTIGTTTSKLSKPVAIALGSSYIYVLCSDGAPSGSTGNGFVAVYDYQHKFKCIALYCGINGGTGKCYEGEIKEPKDMFVTQVNGRDFIYVLNGDDSIGKFDTNVLNTENKLTSKGVINLPSKLGIKNGDLQRLVLSNGILYITSKSIGKVIALNSSNELVGTFGKLADESLLGMDQTLGYFNGLSGIFILNNKVYVSESINNRIQSFGVSLLSNNKFEVLFQPVHLPYNQEVFDICTSLSGDVIDDVKIIDLASKAEMDVFSAIRKKINYFKIKAYIDPMKFSQKRNQISLEPFFVLREHHI